MNLRALFVLFLHTLKGAPEQHCAKAQCLMGTPFRVLTQSSRWRR